jgi:medium-chain acyl-[acyl-carrier-protein] hydrolase
MTQVQHAVDHWLPHGEPDPATPRLFCFPHAGGGAASFASWRKLAGAGLTVCPVQPPGRAERHQHPPHRTVTSYVDDLIAAAEHQFTGTYALFGHSVGSVVAFELVRTLHAAGKPLPVRLFVSGRAAPHLPDTRPRLRDLPTRELIPHLRTMGGTPDVFLSDPELLEVFLPLLRADFTLNETYRHVPAEPLPVPITAFGGDRDPRADVAELRGWAELTGAGFAVHTYPGGHFYLEQHTTALLDVMRAELRSSESR